MGSVRVGILVAATLATGPVVAGESQTMRIAGATPDGAFFAIWDVFSGKAVRCGLARTCARPAGPDLEIQTAA